MTEYTRHSENIVKQREAQREGRKEGIRGAKESEKLINPEEQRVGYQKKSHL